MTGIAPQGLRLGLSALALCLGSAAMASSHREAPMITNMPALDGTDFYMFRSYEGGRENYVTLIANYYPLQHPYGGPNYYNLEDEAVYQIHIDNDGDNVEDLTFSFDFNTILAGATVPVGGRNIAIPLINAGPVGPDAMDTSNVNVRQEYGMHIINGDRRSGSAFPIVNADSGSTTFRKPLDYLGGKSIPDYANYALDHVYPVITPGCVSQGRVFVGQRKEGFAVNLGQAFDLFNLNPLGEPDAAANDLGNENITTIALEIPINCLTAGDPVIGAWTTASMMDGSGGMLQVSRLGNPLINEVVVGLPDKDAFNMSEPSNDAQFAKYVTNPTLPFLLELLFSDAGAQAPSNIPRMDLVQAVSGVPGLNLPQSVANGNNHRSEMLRLNTDIAVTPMASQSNLGVLGDDLAGFPNGRRPGDDVVDIMLRVAMGALIDDAEVAPNNMAPFTDQTSVNAADFMGFFPYLDTPLSGAATD